MTRRRQPLTTRSCKFGCCYRSWFWAPDASSKNKKRGKRRSTKHERMRGKQEIREEASGD